MNVTCLMGLAFLGLGEILILLAVSLLLFGGLSLKSIFHRCRWLYYELTANTDKALVAERKVGQAMAEELIKEMPIDTDPSRKALLMSVANRLLVKAKLRGYVFQFKLVCANEPNAFALPGGYVFVTASLVQQCQQNRDELAFVLAHEMGHVLQSHAKDRIVDGTILSMLTSLVIGGGYAGRIAGKWVRKALLCAYSQDQEFAADRFAMKLLKQVGFDLEGGPRILQKLGATRSKSSPAIYFASHPPIADRTTRMRDCIT